MVERHWIPPYPQEDFGLETTRFEVLRVWRGAVTAPKFELLNHWREGEADCSGMPFEIGRTYLLFADPLPSGRVHVISTGERTDQFLRDVRLGPPVVDRCAGCAGCGDTRCDLVVPTCLLFATAPLRGRKRRAA